MSTPASTIILVLSVLLEGIGKLVEGIPDELGLLPQVGCQERVGVGRGDKRRLERVLERLGRAGRGGVDVAHTTQLQQALDGGRGDQAGTTWGGDELEIISQTALYVGRRYG